MIGFAVSDNRFIILVNNCYYQEKTIGMVPDHSIGKNSGGRLQGLILLWTCGYCENSNIEPLVRKDAVSGKKYSICPNCKGESCVTFSPSAMMSEREKIVQQAMSFIPLHQHKEILEDLAWIEGLFFVESSEDLAKSYWDNLKGEIDYWVQQGSRQKK